jgi:NAD(P)-dependent dehydrogenase (short-subunit alcohol dehydrogenase family)
MWTQVVWDAWMKEKGGAIVNVASLGGLIVGANLGVYHASKAALIHLTRQLALELGPQVRVNAVAPGVVRTRLSEALWREQEQEVAAETPLKRIGEPEDVGSAIAFLASAESSWITGETMVIDGGQILTVPQP